MGHLSVENRTSLLISALIKDIDNFALKTVLNLPCDEIDLESLEADVFNDNFLIIWAPAASNLDTYNRLMVEHDSECLYLVTSNKEGKMCTTCSIKLSLNYGQMVLGFMV